MATKKAAKRRTAKRLTRSTGAKRGPKPNVLKIDGDWKEAMRRSLEKKKPPEGWPK